MFDQPLVRLMHYDARWRQEFQQTRSSLLYSCAGWVTEVHHVGSTSISGLIARPTIDLLAGVDGDAAMDEARMRIEGLNFREISAPDWVQGARQLIKPRYAVANQPEPTHLVWLTIKGSPFWNRLLRIRDWLRDHPETAIRFEEAKVANWRNGEGDLESYQSAKSIFFAHLEDQIEASGDV